MDDMMNMSFDDLRGNIAPSMPTNSGGTGNALAFHSAAPSMLMAPTLPPTIPEHRQELDVLLVGPGAEAACAGAPRAELAALPPEQAAGACKGKRDFILFEELDNAGTLAHASPSVRLYALRRKPRLPAHARSPRRPAPRPRHAQGRRSGAARSAGLPGGEPRPLAGRAEDRRRGAAVRRDQGPGPDAAQVLHQEAGAPHAHARRHRPPAAVGSSPRRPPCAQNQAIQNFGR